MTSRTRCFLDWGWASIFAPRSSKGMEGGCGSKVGKASAPPSFLPSHAHQRAKLVREGKRQGSKCSRYTQVHTCPRHPRHIFVCANVLKGEIMQCAVIATGRLSHLLSLDTSRLHHS